MAGRSPYDVYFDPTSSATLYATRTEPEGLSTVEPSTLSVIAELDLEDCGQPRNLATTPDGIYAVVTDYAKDTVRCPRRGCEAGLRVRLCIGHGFWCGQCNGCIYVDRGQDHTGGKGSYGTSSPRTANEAYIPVTWECGVVVIDAEGRVAKGRVRVCSHPFWTAIGD